MLAKIKKRIVSIFNTILTHTTTYSDFLEIQKNLKRVIILNYEIMPAILPLEEKSKKALSEITSIEKDENRSIQISKEDLMFQFWLHHMGSVESALTGYFSSGYEHATIVKDILTNNFTEIENLKILDFASGHGRVSRFFKSFLPLPNITIAEIKQQAVDFQKAEFGYKGFTSSSDPAQLVCDEQFDFILVSSLFTHLNKNLFALWLQKLGSLLKDNGILSLSLHIITDNATPLFTYSERSEEDLFPEILENLAKKNIYGFTSVNELEFQQLVFKNLGPAFQIIDKRKWGNSQALMSIKKNHL